ncbi:hypothetical protein PV325_004235 [Microctonus aethiopoides]|nr:hypothetical protein PV325_004235 [Microctonus aethiopoides]
MPNKKRKTLQGTKIRTDKCINPLNLQSHPLTKPSDLRIINKNQLQVPNLSITSESQLQGICPSCRVRISKIKKENEHKEGNSQNELMAVGTQKTPIATFVGIVRPVSANEDSDEKVGSGDTSGFSGELLNERVEYLNALLRLIGSSPMKKRKLVQKRYSEEKSENIALEIKEKFSIQGSS